MSSDFQELLQLTLMQSLMRQMHESMPSMGERSSDPVREYATDDASFEGLPFKPGTVVRWKPGMARPRFGWQAVLRSTLGVVSGRRLDGVVLVSFPGKDDVQAEPAELAVDVEASALVRRDCEGMSNMTPPRCLDFCLISCCSPSS